MSIGKENEYIEFKESTSELDKGLISIVSILNKHQKGTLYFGIKDDGTPIGQTIGKDTLRKVSQRISDHIEPKIFPEINQVKLEGKVCFTEDPEVIERCFAQSEALSLRWADHKELVIGYYLQDVKAEIVSYDPGLPHQIYQLPNRKEA